MSDPEPHAPRAANITPEPSSLDATPHEQQPPAAPHFSARHRGTLGIPVSDNDDDDTDSDSSATKPSSSSSSPEEEDNTPFRLHSGMSPQATIEERQQQLLHHSVPSPPAAQQTPSGGDFAHELAARLRDLQDNSSLLSPPAESNTSLSRTTDASDSSSSVSRPRGVVAASVLVDDGPVAGPIMTPATPSVARFSSAVVDDDGVDEEDVAAAAAADKEGRRQTLRPADAASPVDPQSPSSATTETASSRTEQQQQQEAANRSSPSTFLPDESLGPEASSPQLRPGSSLGGEVQQQQLSSTSENTTTNRNPEEPLSNTTTDFEPSENVFAARRSSVGGGGSASRPMSARARPDMGAVRHVGTPVDMKERLAAEEAAKKVERAPEPQQQEQQRGGSSESPAASPQQHSPLTITSAALLSLMRKLVDQNEKIKELGEMGSPSEEDLQHLEHAKTEFAKMKGKASSVILSAVAAYSEEKFNFTEENNEQQLFHQVFEQLVIEGDDEETHKQNVYLLDALLVLGLAPCCTGLNWLDVVDSLGFHCVAAFDGSLKFLQRFFHRLPQLLSRIDPSELLQNCMFSKRGRMPCTLFILKLYSSSSSSSGGGTIMLKNAEDGEGLIHSPIDTVAEELSSELQEFLEDICSADKSIPHEDRSCRMELIDYLLTHPLLKKTLNTSTLERAAKTVFARAAREGDVELLKKLVKLCDDDRKLILEHVNHISSGDDTTPLIQAVLADNVAVVEYLLSIDGIDVFHKNKDGGDALELAIALKRNEKIIEMLAQKFELEKKRNNKLLLSQQQEEQQRRPQEEEEEEKEKSESESELSTPEQPPLAAPSREEEEEGKDAAAAAAPGSLTTSSPRPDSSGSATPHQKKAVHLHLHLSPKEEENEHPPKGQRGSESELSTPEQHPLSDQREEEDQQQQHQQQQRPMSIPVLADTDDENEEDQQRLSAAAATPRPDSATASSSSSRATPHHKKAVHLHLHLSPKPSPDARGGTPQERESGTSTQTDEEQLRAMLLAARPPGFFLRKFRVLAWTVRLALRWIVATVSPWDGVMVSVHDETRFKPGRKPAYSDWKQKGWAGFTAFLSAHWHTMAGQMLLRKFASPNSSFGDDEQTKGSSSSSSPLLLANLLLEDDASCRVLCDRLMQAVAEQTTMSSSLPSSSSSNDRSNWQYGADSLQDVHNFLQGLKVQILRAHRKTTTTTTRTRLMMTMNTVIFDAMVDLIARAPNHLVSDACFEILFALIGMPFDCLPCSSSSTSSSLTTRADVEQLRKSLSENSRFGKALISFFERAKEQLVLFSTAMMSSSQLFSDLLHRAEQVATCRKLLSHAVSFGEAVLAATCFETPSSSSSKNAELTDMITACDDDGGASVPQLQEHVIACIEAAYYYTVESNNSASAQQQKKSATNINNNFLITPQDHWWLSESLGKACVRSLVEFAIHRLGLDGKKLVQQFAVASCNPKLPKSEKNYVTLLLVCSIANTASVSEAVAHQCIIASNNGKDDSQKADSIALQQKLISAILIACASHTLPRSLDAALQWLSPSSTTGGARLVKQNREVFIDAFEQAMSELEQKSTPASSSLFAATNRWSCIALLTSHVAKFSTATDSLCSERFLDSCVAILQEFGVASFNEAALRGLVSVIKLCTPLRVGNLDAVFPAIMCVLDRIGSGGGGGIAGCGGAVVASLSCVQNADAGSAIISAQTVSFVVDVLSGLPDSYLDESHNSLVLSSSALFSLATRYSKAFVKLCSNVMPPIASRADFDVALAVLAHCVGHAPMQQELATKKQQPSSSPSAAHHPHQHKKSVHLHLHLAPKRSSSPHSGESSSSSASSSRPASSSASSPTPREEGGASSPVEQQQLPMTDYPVLEAAARRISQSSGFTCSLEQCVCLATVAWRAALLTDECRQVSGTVIQTLESHLPAANPMKKMAQTTADIIFSSSSSSVSDWQQLVVSRLCRLVEGLSVQENFLHEPRDVRIAGVVTFFVSSETTARSQLVEQYQALIDAIVTDFNMSFTACVFDETRKIVSEEQETFREAFAGGGQSSSNAITSTLLRQSVSIDKALFHVEEQEGASRGSLEQTCFESLELLQTVCSATGPSTSGGDASTSNNADDAAATMIGPEALKKQLRFIQDLEARCREDIVVFEHGLINKTKSLERAQRSALYDRHHASEAANMATKDLQARLIVLEEERRSLAEKKRTADASRSLRKDEIAQETAPLRATISLLEETIKENNMKHDREKAQHKKEAHILSRDVATTKKELAAANSELHEARTALSTLQVKKHESDKALQQSNTIIEKLRQDLEDTATSQSLKQWCHDATSEMLSQSKRAAVAEKNFQAQAEHAQNVHLQFHELAHILHKLESQIEFILDAQRIVSIGTLDTTQLVPLSKEARRILDDAKYGYNQQRQHHHHHHSSQRDDGNNKPAAGELPPASPPRSARRAAADRSAQRERDASVTVQRMNDERSGNSRPASAGISAADRHQNYSTPPPQIAAHSASASASPHRSSGAAATTTMPALRPSALRSVMFDELVTTYRTGGVQAVHHSQLADDDVVRIHRIRSARSGQKQHVALPQQHPVHNVRPPQSPAAGGATTSGGGDDGGHSGSKRNMSQQGGGTSPGGRMTSPGRYMKSSHRVKNAKPIPVQGPFARRTPSPPSRW